MPSQLIGQVPLDELEFRRAQRFLKMLTNLLRRHGHDGPMAVFDKKLQERQSIKQQELAAVLGELQDMGILHYDGAMIYLDTAWEKHWFDGKGRPGLPSLEDNDEAWAPAMQRISTLLAS